jgi:hypothetical protein
MNKSTGKMMTAQPMTDKSTACDESLTRRPTRRVLGLMAVCGLVTFGPVLGPGIAPAAAGPCLDPVGQCEDLGGGPNVKNVRLDVGDAYVTFHDVWDDETQFHITVVERDNWDRVIVKEAPVSAGPGQGRELTRQVSGIPPGVPVCAKVKAVKESGSGIGYRFIESTWSTPVCVDPAKVPSDLALENIRGREELQFAVNPEAAYLVAFRNAGADATGIVVDIATSGVATLGDQGLGRPGWDAGGFSCATRPPAGGETAALHCTGGHLKQGEQTNPAVIVRFNGVGFGHIYASISGAGDTNAGNNGTALNVRVL